MKPVNVKLSKPPQASFKYKKIELESLEFNWHCHPEYEIMQLIACKEGFESWGYLVKSLIILRLKAGSYIPVTYNYDKNVFRKFINKKNELNGEN